MPTCEWSGCGATATHDVGITFPDAAAEEWKVCRAHDRELKLQLVRSRPKAQAAVEQAPTVEVECGDCHRPLDAATDGDVVDGSSCPECGSTRRHIKIGVTETLGGVHDSVRVRSAQAGKGGWMVDSRTGDDYSRDLDAWGRRELTKDRAQDIYREVIELYDGVRLESTARLADHHD